MSTLNVDKVDPSTGTDLEIGSSGDTITIPSGATITNSGTATGFGITAASFRPNVQPLIINGDMQVAQRSTSETGVTSSGYYTCDRWNWISGAADTVTITQESLSAADQNTTGFPKALKVDVTTADASVASGDYAVQRYNFEGQDLQLLNKGTAAAEATTVSFWVKSTKTGTFIANMYDNDNNRLCAQAYTVDTTDTWEKKVLNFPADTTGALDNDNARSFFIDLFLMAGSGYTSGTLATTWATYDATNSAVGQVNALDSTSNNFHITGVQLEVGTYTSSTIPPFQHESYGANLQRCQRYFWCPVSASSWGKLATGGFYNVSIADTIMAFPTPMRAAYTLSYSALSDFELNSNSAAAAATVIVLSNSDCLTSAGVRVTVGSSIAVVGDYGIFQMKDSSARLKFDAEL